MIRNDASQRQVDAARPGWSTWLSANAGSGKTRVLTDRVARLLLAGVDPARILCLTYTRAAASEMQNRLFARLGSWAMKPEDALRVALTDLGIEGEIDADTLASARRLFARAIETPGGLRIQTIHSFCATLLRRFPLEAGVSPQFSELDERAARLLREEIVEEMAESLDPQAIADMAACYSGEDFGQLAGEIAVHSGRLTPALDAAALSERFGLPEGMTPGRLIAETLAGGEQELLAEVAAILRGGSANDIKTASRMAQISVAPDLATLAAMEGVLLYGESKVEGRSYTAKFTAIATKATVTKLAHLQDRLDALMRRVEAARPIRMGLLASRRSAVLHRFAATFLPLYAQRKTLRGALDFADLIARARALLTDPQVAQWVLFRLDGGIDHILVDEAQDTSPDQWKVIELLAQEFTSGQGARETERTIFVVGDQKQSIYSFQGADVAAFSEMRARFRDRLEAIGARFQALELQHSFRSSPAILRLVDATFSPGLHPALGGPSTHIAFREEMPGRIEIWPPVEPAQNPDDDDWSNPVDLITGEHHTARLGRKIAERIREILASGTLIADGDTLRPVHAGDFLILVRRRSPLFSEIIRACKAAHLPIAGADRLQLGGEIAVRDIAALLAFLSTPEDDLALASALRSPLFGLDEAQLYALAQPRKGYLWEALRNDPLHTKTVSVLQDLRDQSDYLRPFDLIERALTRHDGRRHLLARLGAEAEDGINELLSQALAYERNDVPSLTGFLTWLQTDEVEVKRQMESGGRRIRVMTVHGSKGLEAPIVILPDTADLRLNDRDEIFEFGDTSIWRTPSGESPEQIEAIRRDRAERSRAESMRLLYVAMTRAQSWLIVAAAGNLASQKDADSGKEPAWYDLVRAGAEQIGATSSADGTLCYSFGELPQQKAAPPPAQDEPEPDEPAWLRTPAPEPERSAAPLSPSALGGAKVLFAEGVSEASADDSKDRGTALHLLLEHLPGAPESDWLRMTQSLIPQEALQLPLLEEARRVILAPELARIFSAAALTEVTLTADFECERLVGIVDRLLIEPGRVLAVDYKSNQIVPEKTADIPEGIVRQMRAYRTALGQIYPERDIETAVLWTRTAVLMQVT